MKDFLGEDRLACWLMNYLVLQKEFKIDEPSDHEAFVQEALETGLAWGDFQLNQEASTVLNTLAPHRAPHPNRKLGSRQAYTSRLSPGASGMAKKESFAGK